MEAPARAHSGPPLLLRVRRGIAGSTAWPRRWRVKSSCGQLSRDATKSRRELSFAGGDELLSEIQQQPSVLEILRACVAPMLNAMGSSGHRIAVMIWIDSLDEALTEPLWEERPHARSSLDRCPAAACLPWVRIVATSRPDETTQSKLNRSRARASARSDENLKDVELFVRSQLDRAFQQHSHGRLADGLSKVLQRAELRALLGEEEADRLHRAPVCRTWRLLGPATAATICRKADGIFLYAREVLRQLNLSPMLDLETPQTSSPGCT